MIGATTMYHKEYAPDGRVFDYQSDPNLPKPEELVQAGWADNPMKVGVDHIGTPTSRASMERLQHDIKAGKVTMLDDHDGDVERRQLEAEQAQREYQEKMAGLEAIKRNETWRDRAKQGLEQEADIMSDARRKYPDAYKTAEVQIQGADLPSEDQADTAEPATPESPTEL